MESEKILDFFLYIIPAIVTGVLAFYFFKQFANILWNIFIFIILDVHQQQHTNHNHNKETKTVGSHIT